MAELRMTPEQARAVTTLEGDLTISAGAGAGKTSVLGHRFSFALTNGVGGAETAIDRLLTITFTARAAAEVAERIRRVLAAGGLTDEARRIDEAWVSTIHSFCGRLVRRHVLECGIQPGFTTADATMTSELQAEAFERALKQLLRDDPELSMRILEAEGMGSLFARVSAMHDKARSLGLDPASIRIPVEAGDEGEALAEVISCAEELAWVLGGQARTAAVAAKCERLAEWRAELESCGASDDTERCEHLLEACAAYDISRLPGEVRDASDQLKAAIKRLTRVAAAGQHSQVFAWLERLASVYARAYSGIKRERGLLDFDDLQESAVQLLESMPEVADRYREQFDLLMIDEFQDTNALQMRVLEPLRRDNLCVVGDERQAIYGFRYADVEIFRGLEAASPTVSLAKNFRSRPEVLAFVNELFSQEHLFGPEFVRLQPGAEYNPAMGPAVECVVVDSSGCQVQPARELEARWVARSIAERIASGCATGDLAILLRRSNYAGLFASALEAEGIPVIVNAGVSLHDTVEVKEVRDLLRAVAVPEDDEALLSTLFGRVVALGDEALRQISRASGRDSLWSGLVRLSEAAETLQTLGKDQADAVVRTRQAFERLSRLNGRIRLGEFVRTAMEMFDYDVTLHALGAAGVRAWSNVLSVARIAEAFEAVGGNDLAEFVAHLDARRETATDNTAPSEADGGAVRIMTVHAAKGLEFPVVYVADLAAAKEHTLSPVLVEASTDGTARPVVGAKLAEAFGYATTATYTRMEAAERSREIDESKRCLYVACTRAKEALVISGVSEMREPESGKALIDWVREGLGGDAADGIVRLGDAEVLLRTLTPEPEEEAPARECGEVTGAGEGGSISCALEEEVPLAASAKQKPPTVSYSALSLLGRCPLAFDVRYRLGLRPMRKESDSGALGFGSTAHAVLRAVLEGDAAEDAIAREARRAALDGGALARLTLAVEGFLGSELCARVRQAERFSCEEPLLVPLDDTVLVGSVDLIAWRGEQALIVDYKSGKAPDEAGSRRRGEDRHAQYLLQARCYALAAIEAGACEVDVTFAFIEHADRYVSYHFSETDRDVVRGAIQRVADIADAPGPPAHLDAYCPWPCDSCGALGTYCPVSPPSRSADR